MNRKIFSIAAVAAMVGVGCNENAKERAVDWGAITPPRPDLDCWVLRWSGHVECWPKAESPQPETRAQPLTSDCDSEEPAGK